MFLNNNMMMMKKMKIKMKMMKKNIIIIKEFHYCVSVIWNFYVKINFKIQTCLFI